MWQLNANFYIFDVLFEFNHVPMQMINKLKKWIELIIKNGIQDYES